MKKIIAGFLISCCSLSMHLGACFDRLDNFITLGMHQDALKYIKNMSINAIKIRHIRHAVDEGYWNIVDQLVEKITQINSIDEQGDTALTTVLFNDSIGGQAESVVLQAIKILLKKEDIDCNKKSKLGLTPLMLAAYKGYATIVPYLVSRGADKEIQFDTEESELFDSCKNNTAYDFARNEKSWNIAKYLQLYSMQHNKKAVKNKFKDFDQHCDVIIAFDDSDKKRKRYYHRE